MNTKPTVDLQTHNRQVVEEAKSDLNVHGTGEEFHHSPDMGTVQGRNELVLHYIHSGGIAHLEEGHQLVAA